MIAARQTIGLCAFIAGAVVSAFGCSDGSTNTPRRETTTASSGASSSSGDAGNGNTGGNAVGGNSGVGGMGGSGGSGGVGGMGGSGGSGGSGGFGTVEIVDVADTPCTPIVGTVSSLYPDASGAPAFNKLGTVGTKRLAGGRYVPGFATFGLDGTSPSANVVGLDPDFDLVTSEGTTIGLATADGTNVRYQRYTANDATMGSPVMLGASDGSGLAIAGDAMGGSLVVWADSAILNGRYIDVAGNPAPKFTFASGIPTSAIVTSLARRPTEFGLAWSTVVNGKARGRFARLTTTLQVGTIVELTGDSYSHYVVKLVATSDGYALVVHSGLMIVDTIVVILDANGNVKPPARRFLGTKFAFDLGVLGTNLALLAKRSDGSAEFRLLDAAGAPAGSWKCLDGPSQDTYDQAAIDADGAGWAIVYRTPLGGEKFIRTNLTGTAAP